MDTIKIAWVTADKDKLKRLWKECSLSHDKNWHFFFEGPEMFIRVSDRLKDIVAWLEANEIPIIDIFSYEENIPIAKKYIEHFLPIFHHFSELAMKSDVGEVADLCDRVFHCFLNVMRSGEAIADCVGLFGHSRNPTSSASAFWESMMLCRDAIERSWFIGYFQGKGER